jgi:hypothetical protein
MTELEARRQAMDALYKTLEMIASFAPGNGDVCEIIARRTRAALDQADRIMQEAGCQM